MEKVSPGVIRLAVGDPVMLSFAHCGHCENCLTGHPTVCATFNALNFGGAMDDGTHRLRGADGELSTFFGQSSFATHAVVRESNAVKIDADVDLALLGPLAAASDRRGHGAQPSAAVFWHLDRDLRLGRGGSER